MFHGELNGLSAMRTSPSFERSPERSGFVAVRVSPAELERLARKRGTSVSKVLRDGLAEMCGQLHAETVAGDSRTGSP
jgi:hypothetical protein